jgi:hypothetical protein
MQVLSKHAHMLYQKRANEILNLFHDYLGQYAGRENTDTFYMPPGKIDEFLIAVREYLNGPENVELNESLEKLKFDFNRIISK